MLQMAWFWVLVVGSVRAPNFNLHRSSMGHLVMLLWSILVQGFVSFSLLIPMIGVTYV
jgi:hypothetical protein